MARLVYYHVYTYISCCCPLITRVCFCCALYVYFQSHQKVPERYLKVKDSFLTAVDLEKMNALRRHEIETSEEVVAKLEDDLRKERDALGAMQTRKEELLKQLDGEKNRMHSVGSDGTDTPDTTNGATTHRLLQDACRHILQSGTKDTASGNDGTSRTSTVQQNLSQPSKNYMQWLVGGHK